jgi:hypothetical protein
MFNISQPVEQDARHGWPFQCGRDIPAVVVMHYIALKLSRRPFQASDRCTGRLLIVTWVTGRTSHEHCTVNQGYQCSCRILYWLLEVQAASRRPRCEHFFQPSRDTDKIFAHRLRKVILKKRNFSAQHAGNAKQFRILHESVCPIIKICLQLLCWIKLVPRNSSHIRLENLLRILGNSLPQRGLRRVVMVDTCFMYRYCFRDVCITEITVPTTCDELPRCSKNLFVGCFSGRSHTSIIWLRSYLSLALHPMNRDPCP